MEPKLAGRVALVTGASRGIGRAIALELARLGADVAINYARHLDEAMAVVAEIERMGNRAMVVQADVGQREQDETLVRSVLEEFGRLDILVNNAAYSVRKPLLEIEAAEVERTFAVSLWGAFHCTQFAARAMARNGGGSILMVSSVHAARPYPNCSAYNGAKAALNHMACTWAVELAQYRIRVNVLEPGWTDTPGERVHYSEEQIVEKGRDLLMGRLATSDEMAKAAAFLVSDEASYITGAVLRADGGFALTH